MKQNALEDAPGGERAGAWLKLSSATFQTDKGASSPEVRVSATLAEVTPESASEENGNASSLPSGSDLSLIHI